MAAKVNKMVRISLKDGSKGVDGNDRGPFPMEGSVFGGGTRQTGKGAAGGAGFKTRNDSGGRMQGTSTGVKAPDFGAARGTEKNSGNTGGDQY
jgi:hypothetical protein